MKQYRLLLSDDEGETYHHYRNYDSVHQAQEAAIVMPNKDYQVIDIRGRVMACGRTRPSRSHTRGVFDYERK